MNPGIPSVLLIWLGGVLISYHHPITGIIGVVVGIMGVILTAVLYWYRWKASS